VGKRQAAQDSHCGGKGFCLEFLSVSLYLFYRHSRVLSSFAEGSASAHDATEEAPEAHSMRRD
jgi:hypothetical protein